MTRVAFDLNAAAALISRATPDKWRLENRAQHNPVVTVFSGGRLKVSVSREDGTVVVCEIPDVTLR